MLRESRRSVELNQSAEESIESSDWKLELRRGFRFPAFLFLFLFLVTYTSST